MFVSLLVALCMGSKRFKETRMTKDDGKAVWGQVAEGKQCWGQAAWQLNSLPLQPTKGAAENVWHLDRTWRLTIVRTNKLYYATSRVRSLFADACPTQSLWDSCHSCQWKLFAQRQNISMRLQNFRCACVRHGLAVEVGGVLQPAGSEPFADDVWNPGETKQKPSFKMFKKFQGSQRIIVSQVFTDLEGAKWCFLAFSLGISAPLPPCRHGTFYSQSQKRDLDFCF